MRKIPKPLLIGGGLALTAVIAFLAFGVFAIQTLFIDKEVDEANPFDVVASAEATSDAETTDEATDAEAATESEPDTAADAQATTAEVDTVTSGSFIDGDHPTSGTGLTITDGTQTFLRFEGFETDNGPDLNVYLRSSADPDDYIDLGDLKGNIGDQNYELPADIDLARYDFVDIWCVRFGVSFGSATLSA